MDYIKDYEWERPSQDHCNSIKSKMTLNTYSQEESLLSSNQANCKRSLKSLKKRKKTAQIRKKETQNDKVKLEHL